MAKVLGNARKTIEAYSNLKYQKYSNLNKEVPIYASYFSLDIHGSVVDQTSFSFTELIGDQSPIVLRNFKEQPIFSLDIPDTITTSESDDEGLYTEITGSFELIRPAFRPLVGDLIVFNNSEAHKTLLFQISDVTRNAISGDASYQVNFYLFKVITEEIQEQLDTQSDRYLLDIERSGLEQRDIHVAEDDIDAILNLQNQINTLMSSYISAFYCDKGEVFSFSMDTFTKFVDPVTNLKLISLKVFEDRLNTMRKYQLVLNIGLLDELQFELGYEGNRWLYATDLTTDTDFYSEGDCMSRSALVTGLQNTHINNPYTLYPDDLAIPVFLPQEIVDTMHDFGESKMDVIRDDPDPNSLWALMNDPASFVFNKRSLVSYLFAPIRLEQLGNELEALYEA